MKYHAISPALFTRNREKLVRQLLPGTAAIFFGHELVMANVDSNYTFKQNSNFFYLTGIDQEDAILFLFPDAPKDSYKEILFVPRTNDHIRHWVGWKYSPEEATVTSGIRTVRYRDEFETVLRQMVSHFNGVYIDTNEHDRNVLYYPTPSLVFAERMRREFPAHQLHRAAPLLADLRLHKEPEEVELMKKAIEITEKGFRRVLGFVRPGVKEYEIEAELAHEFLRNRATGFAYHPIIASGANSCILHYNENNQECRAGDVLLLDVGAEYGNYDADLTRTIPVSGRFTERQRAVYEAVHRVKDAATQLLRPGRKMQDYVDQVGMIMQDELLKLGLLTSEDVKNAAPEQPAFRKYFTHGIGHPLGIDTHDVGSRYTEFKAGQLYTVEPGIYIPQENLGIRIENNVLITDGEPLDLMASIPSHPDEIERLMNA